MSQLSFAFLFLYSIFSFGELKAQSKDKDDLKYNFDSANNKIAYLHNQAIEKSHLMTKRGFNILMAKKVNTFLTGSSDLSVNKGYFIADPTDGRLLIAVNKALNPNSDQIGMQSILTYGVKTDVQDGFSTLYSGSKKWSGNIGVSFKFTLLFKGSIWYDLQYRQVNLTKESKVQKDSRKKLLQLEKGKYRRQIIINDIKAKMAKEEDEFKKSLTGISDSEFVKDTRLKFYENKNKAYIEEFAENEAKSIEENNGYNQLWKHWLSLDFYFPITSQEYDVANDFNSLASTRKLYNFEGSILYTNLLERRKNRFLSTFNLGFKNQNSVNTETLEKFTIADYKNMGGIDTVTLATLKSKDVYVGKYENYFTPFVKLQLTDFFIADKSIGINLTAEKYLGSFNPLNFKLGIPFALKGKDDDTKASFEVQFKWNDWGNNILPQTRRSDKFSMGISVGIPLASTIY